MQIKTIEKELKNKLIEWLDTISDNTLRDDTQNNLLVSGGSIASMLLNQPINDYDIYLMDIDVLKRLAEYYTKEFDDIQILDGRNRNKLIEEHLSTIIQLNGSDDEDELLMFQNHTSAYSVTLRNLKEDQIKLYFPKLSVHNGLKVDKDSSKYTPVYFSPNAISLSNNIQIVLRFWGTPSEIHKTFDYIHATNYFTFKDGLVRNLEAMESLLTGQLKYQGSHYPLTSIIRAKKFIKRGFNITAGELLKIMYQISKLNLDDPDILEEQLIGVDVAYFSTLIQILRNKYKTDTKFTLTPDTLTEIIDNIFDSSNDVNCF